MAEIVVFVLGLTLLVVAAFLTNFVLGLAVLGGLLTLVGLFVNLSE